MKRFTALLLCLLLAAGLIPHALAGDDWVCPSCGRENTGNFCGDCGAARPDWTCPNCGQVNDTNFCTNCGLKRPDAAAATAEAPTPEPEPTEAPTPEPTEAPTPEPTLPPVQESSDVPLGYYDAFLMSDTPTLDALMDGSCTVLGSGILRSDIGSIDFAAGLEDAPGDAWDVSRDGDGSVLAWVKGDALTIASRGPVCLPDDSSYLFAGYENARAIRTNGWMECAPASLEGLFFHCYELEELDMTGLGTYWATNMAKMFEGCWSLEALDLTVFDTSSAENMSQMFYSCMALKRLDLSTFSTFRVEDMSRMFGACTRLEALDVTGFQTSEVKNMSGMFDSCSALTALDVSGFDTSAVTNMSYMFEGCESLEDIFIVPFDTSRVTNMSHMFEGCKSLVELDVSGFTTNQVTDMADMFRDCESLINLYITGFDTSHLEGLDYTPMTEGQMAKADALDKLSDRVDKNHAPTLFAGCRALEYIWADYTFVLPNLSDHMAREMFDGCNAEIVSVTEDMDIPQDEWLRRVRISTTAKKGDSGPTVAWMQRMLIALGYLDGAADGKFGAKTRDALGIFQANYGLGETDVLDLATIQALCDWYQSMIYLAY